MSSHLFVPWSQLAWLTYWLAILKDSVFAEYWRTHSLTDGKASQSSSVTLEVAYLHLVPVYQSHYITCSTTCWCARRTVTIPPLLVLCCCYRFARQTSVLSSDSTFFFPCLLDVSSTERVIFCTQIRRTQALLSYLVTLFYKLAPTSYSSQLLFCQSSYKFFVGTHIKAVVLWLSADEHRTEHRLQMHVLFST